MDAVTKLCRFSAAGAATGQLQPVLGQHFGSVDSIVKDKHAAGTFNLDSCIEGAEAAAEEAEEEQEEVPDLPLEAPAEEAPLEGECTTRIQCARCAP